MVENNQLDIEEIVRDSFDENETEQLAEKLDQLEPEEIAIALEAMPLEQRVSTWLTLENASIRRRFACPMSPNDPTKIESTPPMPSTVNQISFCSKPRVRSSARHPTLVSSAENKAMV